MNVNVVDRQRFAACVATGEPYDLLTLKAKVTWRCNLTCSMCSYWRRPGLSELSELSTEQWEKVISDAASLGCRKIHFSGGEPLLRSDLEHLVMKATALSLQVNLTSNGTLLSEERAESLVGAGIHSVTLSIDSPSRKVHDKVRGAGAWRATVEGAKRLRRAAKKHRSKVGLRINVVLSKKTYRTAVGVPELASHLRAKGVLLIPVDDTEGRGQRLGKRQIQEYNTVAGTRLAAAGIGSSHPFGISARDISLSSRGLYALGEYDSQPCLIPWVHSFILPDGQVFPCCMRHGSGPRLGSVASESLVSTWHSRSYMAFRRQLLVAQPVEPCVRCDDFIAENRALRTLIRERDV